MGQKLVVGPFNKGLRNDQTAFNIDNDSFPTLINAYQWRGRVKRKRGTSLLGRLKRYIGTTSGAGGLVVIILPIPIAEGITSFTVGTDIFTDPGGASPVNLLSNRAGSTATLDRTTGTLTIAGSQINTSVFYIPGLPVMGLEEFAILTTSSGTIAFDTKYSYNISTTNPYPIYDISFYKNPATAAYTNYVQKGVWTKTSWNGQDYQQFWTTNYQGAFWATNGINIPFSISNMGMQYKQIVAVTVLTPTTATLQINIHGLVVGDFVFVNEVATTTGINFQTGYVTTVTDINNVIVTFPNATLATNGAGGIAQYLTSRADSSLDCLRWYDGDPTNGNASIPTFVTGKGWVNFAPPLSQFNFSIADLPAHQYYLIGARMILPFKDRLLFIGPVVQTSAAGSQVYLQDTVIYSQNGTPFYTASFTGDPTLATTVFNPILVPVNQTATASAYFEDQTGFGGFITAGLDEPIVTSSSNEDILIMGFTTTQARFVYTGNDIVPFTFFIINSELGSGSTFSAINMDKGVITRGSRGFTISSQTDTERIDLEIPDEVFELTLTNNGAERFCAQRDFVNEWIYFTYPVNTIPYKFPNQTLQFNYRDNSWAIFYESYTTYGKFRKLTGYTWGTVGSIYPTWGQWNVPWNAGSSTLLQEEVIAGNQQGFVVFRDDGTAESNSLSIQNISGSTVTSPQHNLNEGDFIIITGCYGTVGASVNARTFSVSNPTTNTFDLDPTITSGTYLGGGVIKRAYVPYIQTKQFPLAWDMGRKTRIGMQQYLLSTTDKSQITLLIFLSQNDDSPYNSGSIVPNISSDNNSLIYSTVLYTCPESTNLGLTPANINLNMPTAINQQQIWHRINTSLIGDTVQLGFTISEDQMTALTVVGEPFAITGATQANPCVLTCTGGFSVNQLITIDDVSGMTELNGNTYAVVTSGATTVTINVDSTAFTAYTSGGTATLVANVNAFEEVVVHGFIMDISPSMLLA